MRVQMQHPAIVSRRKRDQSEPAYAMVRATSTIDVAEYATSDVQTAAILHHGAGTTTYRRIGGHLYKQLDHMPATALARDTDMAHALVGRDMTFDFGSFMRIVQDAAIECSTTDNTLYKNVAYVDRPLSRQDQRRAGNTAQLTAFRKAPEPNRQTWLSSDAEGEISEWARKFEEFMENVALVHGIVHVRSFEPCYTMQLGRGSHRLEVSKMSAMQIWLGGPREVARNGIPCLGPRWDYTEDKYFSLIERDRAVELACQFGLANEVVLATSTKDVTIVDPSALSSDFVKEETYRLAVLALHIADDLANEVAGSSHSNVTVREALAARLGEIGNPEARLKALVHPGAAQDEAMQDAVTKELLATFERAGEIVNGGTMRRVAALRDGIEFLDARRDAMPISLMTTPNSPSPH